MSVAKLQKSCLFAKTKLNFLNFKHAIARYAIVEKWKQKAFHMKKYCRKDFFKKRSSLTFFRFDLEDFMYNQVNMTAFRLVDGDNIKVRNVLHEMETISPIGKAILNQSQVHWLSSQVVVWPSATSIVESSHITTVVMWLRGAFFSKVNLGNLFLWDHKSLQCQILFTLSSHHPIQFHFSWYWHSLLWCTIRFMRLPRAFKMR